MLGLDPESFKEQCKSAPFNREDYIVFRTVRSILMLIEGG